MRELLIRYLLGELDAHEQRQLEERLRTSAELRSELAHLQSCFAAARETDQAADEPPRGLARRVTDSVCGDNPPRPVAPAAAEIEPPSSALGWSLADMTVAGGVLLAVSMLLFPALRDSRDATRRTVCQNNQREISMLLFRFASDNGGRYFPCIAPGENGGSFAMQLVEGGYVDAEDMSVLLICPSGPLADKIRASEYSVWIPRRAELESMTTPQLAEVRQRMSPFFAYQFPYYDGEKYVYMRDQRNPFGLLISDTSSTDEDMSPNHDGFLQAIGADGRLRYLKSCEVPGGDKDVYRNARGEVAAGCDRSDIVLGRSEATPGLPLPRPARKP